MDKLSASIIKKSQCMTILNRYIGLLIILVPKVLWSKSVALKLWELLFDFDWLVYKIKCQNVSFVFPQDTIDDKFSKVFKLANDKMCINFGD